MAEGKNEQDFTQRIAEARSKLMDVEALLTDLGAARSIAPQRPRAYRIVHDPAKQKVVRPRPRLASLDDRTLTYKPTNELWYIRFDTDEGVWVAEDGKGSEVRAATLAGISRTIEVPVRQIRHVC